MKVSVEKLSTSEAVLNVDLTWDELEKASDKAYRKLVQKFDVQGFRRGKAPRSLLERKLGKEHIYQEGLEDLIQETYRKAIKEYELTPITQPELDAPVLEMGQPYHFSLKVPILTPVVLGDYASLHFEREDASVTSEEVEQEIETLRNRQATWHEVERPAEYNDRVTTDLKLTVEEKGISDLKDHVFELTQERHGLFSGIDEHIVGMRAGESKEFTTTIPADYTNEKLAGKEGQYVVTVHKVEAKEVPELDDELATKVSDGQYETLEDLRKAISDRILADKKRRINEELREKVVNAVVEQSQVSVHPILVKDEAEHMLHQFEHLLERQHMSLDQYLMMVRRTREEYLKELEPEAEQRVKRQLVLEEVADKENIDVTAQEAETLLSIYDQSGRKQDRSDAQLRGLIAIYRREKAISRLLELTTDPDPDEEVNGDVEEEASTTNAEAAALADETAIMDIEGQIGEIEEPKEQVAPTVDETTASPAVGTEFTTEATFASSDSLETQETQA